MTQNKIIKISCRAAELVPFDKLVIIQDDLKSLSKENFEALKNEITSRGFCFAIHVWLMPNGRLGVLDGTQRHRVLGELLKEGWQISGVPINYVEAENERDAVLKLLGAAGAYGHPEEEGLYALMEKHQLKPIDVPNIRLPGISLPKFVQNFYSDSTIIENEIAETPTDQFIVAIQCKNENEMQLIYEEMKTRGMECKLIT